MTGGRRQLIMAAKRGFCGGVRTAMARLEGFLATDPAELHNRADSEPERLAAMRETLARWLDSTESVRPLDPGTDTGNE